MMKQEDLFKKLGLILNELNDQYQFLSRNPQQLSELELELFHANANFLADHVQIIKKISASQPPPLVIAPAEAPKKPQVNKPTAGDEMQEECMVEDLTFPDELADNIRFPEAEKSKPKVSSIEKEVFKLDQSPSSFEFIINEHSENDKFDFEEKSAEELFDRPLSLEEEKILAQKKKITTRQIEEPLEIEEDEIGPEPFLVVKEAKEFPIKKEDLTLKEAPIAKVEVPKANAIEDPNYKPTLNDLLAKSKSAVSINTAGVTVKDLKSSINLNDKLLYIKDLFNGYNLAYSEAIDLANKLPDFEAADTFFQKNYALKNNWAEKQATVTKFYALLKQRFG